MLEDKILIRYSLDGQTEYFVALMDRHRTAVRTRIRSIVRNTADEDNLVQEVLMKDWRHLPSFRADASFRTWIMRIAINEVLQLHRRESYSPLLPANVDLDMFAPFE